MSSDVAQLGLGTAQFGLDYGIANPDGRVAESQVRAILDCAREHGISILDTAAAYGDSESVLGRVVGASGEFAIVTKTVPVPATERDPVALSAIAAGFRASLERLRTGSVYGLLVHHGELLLRRDGDRLCALLEQWRREGLVRKIGASVYDGAQALRLAERFPLELVQLPINVFDQSSLRDGSVRALHERGVEVHARSVFLQGLLLMDSTALPDALSRFAPRLQQFRDFVMRAGHTPLQAALGFVLQQPHVRVALVGVTSVAQLRECAAAAARGWRLDLEEFASSDAQLIDPRRWTRQ